jgi:hypothetical protein
MPRRLLIVIAFAASLAVVACTNTPAAPALTDPKDILVQSIASLQNVKTATIKGTFTGAVNAAEAGNFDLSSVKIDLALDVPAKKTRATVDAPTLMGTKLDLIVADGNTYLQIVGPLAALIGGDATGKYTKTAVGETVPDEATDPAKVIAELRKGVDQLPRAPEKLADERCGDQDCYHVRLALTGADLATLGAGEAGIGNVSVDIFTRKNDLRPGRITFALDMGAQGNVGGTFEFTYDQGVNISAPPADQIAP